MAEAGGVSKRTVWVAAFLAVTALAVGAELLAALDHNPNTVPWTDLIATYVPRPVTFAAIALLCAWLPAHFTWAYRHKPSTEGGAMKYAKAGVAILTAGLTAAQEALPMSPAAHSYVAVALAVLGAAAVWAVPNAAPTPPAGVTGPYVGR